MVSPPHASSVVLLLGNFSHLFHAPNLTLTVLIQINSGTSMISPVFFPSQLYQEPPKLHIVFQFMMKMYSFSKKKKKNM